MDDELMRCPVCGAPRASRYAAYCHECGSPLPELPPDPNEPTEGAPEGWEDPATAAAPAENGNPPGSYPTGTPPASYAPGAYPAGSYAPGPGPVRQDYSFAQGGGAQGGTGQPVPPPVPPGAQPLPPAGGAVRVYDRPETPPSVVRRRQLTWILAAIGVVIGLLMLTIGPLRTVLGARSGADWSPPGTETPVAVIIPTLPPGVSAAQATARARYTPTTAPTWTPGVPVATTQPGGAAGGGNNGGGAAGGGGAGATGGGGLLPTVVLPTLGPAPTATPVPPTVTAVPPTQPPPATAAPATAAPATAPTPTPLPPAATAVPPTPAPAATATPAPPANTPVPNSGNGSVAVSGANLPAAISGGKVIAFVSDRSGTPQVWLAGSGGGNQLQVTRQGTNTSPSWSPDNRYLYYIGQRGGQTAVYRLDVTTGKEEQLIQDATLVSARPLPNGQLAVLRNENGRYTLYEGDRRLFQLDRSFQFQFSTDGSLVLIDPNADPRVVSVVNVASTKATDIAPARSWNAGWGQGNRLTYVSDKSGIAAVYVAGANGQGARPISPGDKWSQAPAFSSDASQVAFIGGDGPVWNVYVVGADGQNAHKVGGPANPNKSPLWQPGGGLIAYESDRKGKWDIYVTDPAGNERALTSNAGNNVDPAWTY